MLIFVRTHAAFKTTRSGIHYPVHSGRQFRVIVSAVLREATRNTIEPLIEVGVLRRGQVDDRAPTPAIAIFERMAQLIRCEKHRRATPVLSSPVWKAKFRGKLSRGFLWKRWPKPSTRQCARLPKVPRKVSMARHNDVIMLLDYLRSVERSATKSRTSNPAWPPADMAQAATACAVTPRGRKGAPGTWSFPE